MIKEYTYLGRTRNGACCILKSTLPKNEIIVNALELKPIHFVHSSTNWGGCDDFNRVCELKHLKITGEELDLSKNPLVFQGVDYDMGHEYSWQISVERITFCEEDEQGMRDEKLMRSVNTIKSRLWSLKNSFADNIKSIEEELSELERMAERARNDDHASKV